MSKQMYEVLEVKGKAGLTVGDVLKPGQQFSHEQWPYDEVNLEAAIKNKRCKKIDSKKSKPADNEKEKEKLEKKIAAMTKAYEKMNPEDPKAEKLLTEIQELQKGD